MWHVVRVATLEQVSQESTLCIRSELFLINSLQPTWFCIYRLLFKSMHSAHGIYAYMSHGSQNKQQFFS
jgi:hypothetical protein